MTEDAPTDTPQVHLGFQSKDLADAEKGKAKRVPRRIVYFQNGDELEEYSTEEEEDEPDKIDSVVAEYNKMDWKTMGWGSYIANISLFGLLKTIKKFEYAGEVISDLFGITSPKYQSEIEEAERMEAEEAEEKKRSQENDASWTNGLSSDPQLRTPQKSFKPPEAKALFDGEKVSISAS
ncbi:protein FAM177A1 [Galendromus occidentalis]|uniref:Protein FAM177A1 n=1 Tax=Galendromus occidentalis TaxID=34638 RepID=A0AAJ7SFN3_9ACAR|nr:protein FAM177A1 [Galendromus occidentalis]